MVLQWQWLVLWVVKRWWRAGHNARRRLDIKDLVQAGFIALIRAAQKYDPARGAASFRTYAIKAIRHAVVDEATQSYLIRVPRYVQRGKNQEHRCRACAETAKRCEIIAEPPDKEAPEPKEKESFDRLYQALAQLDSAQREHLAKRFGLDGLGGCTQAELARVEGKSRQSMRARDKVALKNLREAYGRTSA
jgi:RNA polymerase sigma factor (sigma-70 family)